MGWATSRTCGGNRRTSARRSSRAARYRSAVPATQPMMDATTPPGRPLAAPAFGNDEGGRRQDSQGHHRPPTDGGGCARRRRHPQRRERAQQPGLEA